MEISPITLKTNLSTGMLPKAQAASAKYQLNKFLNRMPEGTIAYIAGGAPRDWHHGWGCRDVDIFFKSPDTYKDLIKAKETLSEYEQVGEAYGCYNYGVDQDQGILSIHEYPVISGSLRYRKVQLIRLRSDPLQVIKDFPINMSHIWMDRRGLIQCDTWYKSGYNQRYITPVHNKQYYYPYLEKILPRYSEYAFLPTPYLGTRDEIIED